MSRITYIIQSGETDYYKIGSSANVQRRLAALQGGNPELLHLRFVIEPKRSKAFGHSIEDMLHLLLQHSIVRYGEWFYLPELTTCSLDSVLKWLGHIGFAASSVERKGLHFLIKVLPQPVITKIESAEVDTSLILFLNAQQANQKRKTELHDLLTGLPQYHPDRITQSLCKLTRNGYITARRSSKELYRFYLNDKLNVGGRFYHERTN